MDLQPPCALARAKSAVQNIISIFFLPRDGTTIPLSHREPSPAVLSGVKHPASHKFPLRRAELSLEVLWTSSPTAFICEQGWEHRHTHYFFTMDLEESGSMQGTGGIFSSPSYSSLGSLPGLNWLKRCGAMAQPTSHCSPISISDQGRSQRLEKRRVAFTDEGMR